MRDLTTILNTINKATERYEICQLGDTHTQSEILRDISTALHFLAAHRISANENWMSVYFNSKANSSAAKEREADFRVPELYKIRHFMQTASKVQDSLRSTISALKNG